MGALVMRARYLVSMKEAGIRFCPDDILADELAAIDIIREEQNRKSNDKNG